LPVPGCLSAALREWKALQKTFKGRWILVGFNFAASEFVFAGYSGAPFSNHGLRHSAATILLNHVGEDLRKIQEPLRHKNIRTTVRYTHVGYEQTRQTPEALSQALE
jgi:integrase